MENRAVNKRELLEILKLKSNMNSKRVMFNINDLPKRELTPYRLLGFIEGDGSFSISNKSPELNIGIQYKNLHFLYEISEFLSKLPFNPTIGPKQDLVDSKPRPSVRV